MVSRSVLDSLMEPVDFSEGKLPSARRDLELLDGGRFADQSKRWLLFDHVADEFFELDTLSARMFKALSATIPFEEWLTKLKDIEPEITIEQVNETLNFFLNEGLLADNDPRVQVKKLQSFKVKKQSLAAKLLHNYLFFKVPLLAPEPWIGHLANRLTWLRSRPVLALRVLLLGYCVVVLVSRFNELTSTFVDYVSFKWIFLSAICIAFFKIVHELAHGVVAKWYGARVSQMGIAFLLLFPIFYTDATDAWRIKNPKKRRKIAMAGVMAELQIAAVALVAWSFLPEGWTRSLCFVMFLSGLIPSLLVNLNPLMRFDAYFWLSDYWGVTNLQARAFAAGRAWMRYWLFGFPLEQSGIGISNELKLAIFSYFVWVYRFFLFLGIALLVYSIDFKLLGIFLFLVEIWVFIARPIYRELATVFARREQFRLTKTTVLIVLCSVGFVLWVALPSTSNWSVQAVLKPEHQIVFVTEQAGSLVSLRQLRGPVETGEPLFEVRAPNQDLLLAEAQLRVALASNQLDAARRGQMSLEIGSIRQQLVNAEAQVKEVQRRIEKLNVVAPQAGQWLPEHSMNAQDRVPRGRQVGILLAEGRSEIVAYVTESMKMEARSAVEFLADNGTRLSGAAEVRRSSTAERKVSSPLLVSSLGGELAAYYNSTSAEWMLVSPLYRLSLTLDQPFAYDAHLRGTLTIDGEAQSWLRRWAGVILNDLRNEIQW